MSRNPKWVLITLALLSAVYFLAFIFPNAAASSDNKMVLVFEPDEAVPLPYVLDMIQPAESLKQTLINFAFYDYYFYGYPHFAYSALALLPVKWAGQIDNTALVMAVLRQVVSLLPMLAAIWVLVYLQTRFQSYKAIVLFILLASIPAVVQNNFWWHPDGLAILLMMLAIFFLARDNLRYGRHFYLSAAMCGLAAMTKGIGFYFFLSVGLYLAIGLIGRKAAPKKIILSAIGYLLVMAAAYFAANPILVYSGVRRRFFEVMATQSMFLTQGYDVQYPVGLAAAWPALETFYGSWPMLLAAIAACLWGVWRGPNRLLQALILAWAIPVSILDFGIIHFKFQYWLPVALPLFSAIAVILPERDAFRSLAAPDRKIVGPVLPGKTLISMVVLIQLAFFLHADVIRYSRQLRRAENNPAITFYQQVRDVLAPLPEQPYSIYHDVRMYVPPNPLWSTEAVFEMLTYPYIQQRNFDILLLLQSRIYDYLNPKVVAIDAAQLALGRRFYQDAEDETLQGYRLLHRDGFGLVYLKESLYQEFFALEGMPAAELAPPACLGCPPKE